MPHQYTAPTTFISLPESRLIWALYAIAIALISAIYFADLRHLLLGADDAGTFRDHGAINENFLFFFSPEKERASGRIVDEFIMWVVHLVCGNSPAVFHLLVVFIHALASFSLAVCFRRLGAEMITSLIGGLLFLLNIAHVETVHWISALEYPMVTCNLAWTLYFFSRFAESGRRLFLYLFYPGLILCVFTHFVAVLLWPLCLFYAWLNCFNFRSVARALVLVTPALAIALVFVFSITGGDTTTQSAIDHYSQTTSQLSSVLTFVFDSGQAFLWLLARPVFMAHWLPLAPGSQHPIEAWLGMLVLVLLVGFLWRGNTATRLWSAWVVLFLIPFVPATLVYAGISRYIYIATAGSSLLLAWTLNWAVERAKRGGPYVLVLALFLVMWSSYRAEDRIANIMRYFSGHYYIANDDPHLGVDLLQKAMETDTSLLSLGEAYLYLVEGLLMTGQDYDAVLQRALEEVPKDPNIRLLARISALLMDATDHSNDPGILNELYSNYTGPEKAFLHTMSILSQHFGNWYSQNGDSDGAIRSYRLSLRADPQNFNTTQRLLKIQLQQGRYSDAIATIEALKNYQGDSPQFLYLAALCYKSAGKPQEAMATAQRALQIEPSADLYRLEGDLLLEDNRMAEAETAYRRAIAVGSKSPEPFLQIAYIYRKQGRTDAALRVLENLAVTTREKHPVIQSRLGGLYYAEGRVKDAVAAYQRAVEIDPNYALAHSNLGTVLRSLGRIEEAEQAHRRAIELQVDNSLFHEELGRLLVRANKREAAIEALAKAAELDSVNFNLYLTLGQLYLEGNQPDKALSTHRFIMRHTWPTARADDYAGIGANLHALGQMDAALAAYRRAMALDPNNTPTHTNLGWLLYVQGKYREAIGHYLIALEHQPNATAQFNMGLAHMALGDFAAARQVYAQGIERFGAEEAQSIGAVDDLRALLAKSPSKADIRQLLNEFWPQ
ncbi:MAG: tetratricopeptide (TPR) repeat protein [Candidatus Latescibacterota bacterium]|jgi:tetratricopeptide (TPR) repeat protein